MAKTTNLGMTVINSSDYISPDPINDNFEIVDQLGVDYVTSSGTSGNWWFRKWNSGRAECGIDYLSFGTVSITSEYAENMFKNATDLKFGAYPFTFSSVPFVVIYPHYFTHGSSVIVKPNSSSSVSQSPTFTVICEDSCSGTLYCGIYVCGKVSS